MSDSDNNDVSDRLACQYFRLRDMAQNCDHVQDLEECACVSRKMIEEDGWEVTLCTDRPDLSRKMRSNPAMLSTSNSNPA
jgi:hypothetical protein